MSFVYHLVSNGSAHCRYVRISGTAAAPVIEAEVVLIPTSVTNITYGIWSPDGGATLWVVGEDNFATPDLSLVLVRSTDGGATWTNRQAALPPITGRHTVRAIGGFAGDQSVVLAIETPFGVDNLSKLNTGTDLFEITKDLTGSIRPNSVWADEGTGIIYAHVANGTTGFFRSLDQGSTWQTDATYLTGMTQVPWHVVTDPRDGHIYTLGHTTASVCRHGVWGGPWTNDPAFPASAAINTPEGRWLGCDETGAVWALLYNNLLGHQVYRRDPGTGVWALSLQGVTGNRGGLWVIDSQNVVCSIGSYLYFYDGLIWHDYHCAIDLGLTDDVYRGIWAAPPVHVPVVQNQNPAPLSSGNRGDGTIYAEVVDADGNLTASSVQFWANGQLAWGGSSAATGWTGSRTPMTNGYQYSFAPDTPLPVGTITMRVYAVDGDGNVLDETWTFDTASFLDSLDLLLIPRTGGTILTATGLFSQNPLAVHLGPAGTVSDPPCYGGFGEGYAPVSEDGVTVEFASPPLEVGTADLTIVDGAQTLNLGSIDVVERTWPSSLFEHRRTFPPWLAVGPRRLELEQPE